MKTLSVVVCLTSMSWPTRSRDIQCKCQGLNFQSAVSTNNKVMALHFVRLSRLKCSGIYRVTFKHIPHRSVAIATRCRMEAVQQSTSHDVHISQRSGPRIHPHIWNGFKIKINLRNSRASVSFSECISILMLLHIDVIPDKTHLVESAQWHHQTCHEQICNGQRCHQVIGHILQIPLEYNCSNYKHITWEWISREGERGSSFILISTRNLSELEWKERVPVCNHPHTTANQSHSSLTYNRY